MSENSYPCSICGAEGMVADVQREGVTYKYLCRECYDKIDERSQDGKKANT